MDHAPPNKEIKGDFMNWLRNCFHYGFTNGIPCLPSLHAHPVALKTPFPIRESRFLCVESLKRCKNRNGWRHLVTSNLGTARLSNDLLHVLNLGLAAAESTELNLVLVNVLDSKYALTVSESEGSHLLDRLLVIELHKYGCVKLSKCDRRLITA